MSARSQIVWIIFLDYASSKTVILLFISVKSLINLNPARNRKHIMPPKGGGCLWVTGRTACSLLSWALHHVWLLLLPLSSFTSPLLDCSHPSEPCKVARNEQKCLGVPLTAANHYQCWLNDLALVHPAQQHWTWVLGMFQQRTLKMWILSYFGNLKAIGQ